VQTAWLRRLADDKDVDYKLLEALREVIRAEGVVERDALTTRLEATLEAEA